jgi:hypothetical protein
MIDLKATVANLAWGAACQASRLRMRQALDDPEAAQLSVLQRLLRANGETVFGHEHCLSRVRALREYQDAIPVRDYDGFSLWIERVKTGEPNVLTAEPVLAFERSSGSTAAAKYIPYTAALRSEFQEAIRAWMGDLYSQHPSLFGGPAYWLISPLKHPREKTSGGIPVGFETDVEYLGLWERKLASWLFAVPQDLSQVQDLNESMDQTLRHLIQRRELRLISVWNPSYLTLLWQRFMERQDEFIQAGKRVQHPRELWPRLAVISGWADGAAEGDAADAARLFDHATFQPKGLLATEGVITIPWGDGPGAVPALRSHLLEFIEIGGTQALLAHELEVDHEYEVVITTGGGLWRYRLGDIVRVVGRQGRTPRLRFAGRSDGVCDLRGEKLHPRFVGDVLRELSAGFAMLAPSIDIITPHYILFTDRPLSCTANQLDKALSANPHYAHCRSLAQLGVLRVFLIEEEPRGSYLRRCESLGQRAGVVKITPLHRAAGWENWFKGKFMEDS